jgi:hypothetical protein
VLVLAQTAPCSGCQPKRATNGWRVDNVNNGEINVCFQEGSFTPTEIAGLTAGLNYWPTYFSGKAGYPQISMTFNQNGTCNISVTKVNTLGADEPASSLGSTNGSTLQVKINESWTGNPGKPQNFWAWIGAHEVEHLQGMDHSQGGSCNTSLSMMVNIPPDLNTPLPTTPPCSDLLGVQARYSGGGTIVEYPVTEPYYDNGFMCTADVYYWELWWFDGEGNWTLEDEGYEIIDLYDCFPI